MTRYLCAPDSFKESLTAMEAAKAMAQGIRNADHTAEVRCLPMADGGEGTARALVDATGGAMRDVRVHDPLGRGITGSYGLLGDGATAVVETAEASGLALLAPDERDPLTASSYGTGELILAAAHAGAGRIVVGLGGSATNDAGAGLLSALGVRLLDRDGEPIAPGGAALKGFLNAGFRPGIDIVIETSGLDEATRWADVVFTGEGSIDFQTKFGKTPAGVARTAKSHGRPVVAIAGHVGEGIGELHGVGIDAVFGVAPGAATLDELLRDAAGNVAFTAEQVARTLSVARAIGR